VDSLDLNRTKGTEAMPPDDSPLILQTGHERAIEFLADDTHTPVEQITEIYEREFAKLKLDASVQTYLPLLTMRKVREILRLQNSKIIREAQSSSDQSSQPLLQWCSVRNKVVLLPRTRSAAGLATSSSQTASRAPNGISPA
jgi:hypothetical protein